MVWSHTQVWRIKIKRNISTAEVFHEKPEVQFNARTPRPRFQFQDEKSLQLLAIKPVVIVVG